MFSCRYKALLERLADMFAGAILESLRNRREKQMDSVVLVVSTTLGG